jgi:hypothetical protein
MTVDLHIRNLVIGILLCALFGQSQILGFSTSNLYVYVVNELIYSVKSVEYYRISQSPSIQAPPDNLNKSVTNQRIYFARALKNHLSSTE